MEKITACRRCILDSRVPGVFFDSDRICNFCRGDIGVAREADRARLRKLRDSVKSENRTVLVAFSGGDDSAACLTYLLQFDLPCTCILVDNGFIPDTVRKKAAEFCESLGVDLEVRSFSLVEALGHRFRDPCSVCMPRVFDILAESSRRYGAQTVATGHLYGPAFKDYRIGSARFTRVTPLYIDTVDEPRRKQLLARAGRNGSIRFGPSSNCALIGYLEFAYRKKWGYSPQLAELSHEIRAGTLTRASALKKLETKPVFHPEYEKVLDLLRRKGKMQIWKP